MQRIFQGEEEFFPVVKIFTITEITIYLKTVIESDELLENVSLKGEISNFSESMAGHSYFTLKDSGSQIRCALFKGSRQKVKFPLKDGLKVVATGRIAIYEKQGYYQLIVDEMKREGLGELYEKYLQLKKKLQDEGLFDRKFKKELPFFPKTVGIVTSPHGAAVHDIIRMMKKRNDCVGVVLSPVVVQGKDAPSSICEGLKAIEKYDNIDVIIVGRGGGSFEELMPFNDEKVARAIFNCTIPVISAVGHETDFTISDMVADVRALTPTAAAQMVTPVKEELIESLETVKIRMQRSMNKMIEGLLWKLQSIKSRPIFKYPSRYVEKMQQNLDTLYSSFTRAEEVFLERAKRKLQLSGTKLMANNPGNILDKGYSLVYRMPDFHIIKKIDSAKVNDDLNIKVSDGSILAKVTGVTLNSE